ncbi:MAG: hypothetical protein OCD76_25540 [Reichenbachiella sp.]
MKITAYIRFIVGGLYALIFLITELTANHEGTLDSIFWISEIFTGLVVFVYLTYCIKQGTKELQNDNTELLYPRILAVTIEVFIVGGFIFVLTQVNGTQITPLIPNLILVVGMGYLLTQNLRILAGKS